MTDDISASGNLPESKGGIQWPWDYFSLLLAEASTILFRVYTHTHTYIYIYTYNIFNQGNSIKGATFHYGSCVM